jgi:hypothetical protein
VAVRVGQRRGAGLIQAVALRLIQAPAERAPHDAADALEVRGAGVADLAGRDQVVERPRHLLDRGGGVEGVHVEQSRSRRASRFAIG